MPTIHLKQTTSSTPEQFVAALTDFGPGRSKIFGNSADGYLKVHNQGAGARGTTGDRRQACPQPAVRQDRQSHRSPRQRRVAGGLTQLAYGQGPWIAAS